MEVRHARPEELDTILELFEQAKVFMRQNGNPNQWGANYPGREQIASDIRLGHSYVAETDGEIAALFYFDCGVDVEPDYAVIDGAWQTCGQPYGVMHRVVSTGKFPGMVRLCSDWCLERCPSLRIDTHADNGPMQDALNRCGFRSCGIVTLADGTTRIAFEKVNK